MISSHLPNHIPTPIPRTFANPDSMNYITFENKTSKKRISVRLYPKKAVHIIRITRSILTSLATPTVGPTHWEFSVGILALNVWVALKRSRLKELFWLFKKSIFVTKVDNLIYDSQYVKADIATILSNWFESDSSGQIDLSH